METESGTEQKYTNRLADEKSPYLLQHAHNPVDWFPWGEQAFQKAAAEDKPVFLSIGYATCHWCHVMERESFEDEEVARLLNSEYVSIKVDREERPDIDNVYMTACQALTGRGGWPLSIFMTPDRKPYYAGSYFPKRTRGGMPGFMEILSHLAGLWQNDRARILNAAREITNALQPQSGYADQESPLNEAVLKKGAQHLARSFDPKWGGFGEAPKFPSPHQLTFLLRWSLRSDDFFALQMVEKTLDCMRNGGIFDQIGFGFARYSVDNQWLAPHFEKMLYDQATLLMAYTEAYQVMGHERFAKTAREIATYALRDMTAPEGGFYSAEDADSEGKEGLFYIWKPEQVVDALGRDAGDIFCKFYDIRPGGNFEDGYSIPRVHTERAAFASRHGMEPAELDRVLEESRQKLFETREKRVHPLKDDKILTSWNGLMIAALAKASRALGEPAYAAAAQKAADFVLSAMRAESGTFLRRYREGSLAHPAYLDDYAFFTWGLIELYETGFDTRFLEQALAATELMIDLFWDEADGGFFFTGKENEQLITKSKEIYDGAIPSGNSVAALNLLRLGRMTGKVELEEKAERMFKAFGSSIAPMPKVYTQFLNAVDFLLGPNQEIVIAGNPETEAAKSMIEIVHRHFLPRAVSLLADVRDRSRLAAIAPFTEAMKPVNGNASAYVCEQYACSQPITEPDELEKALR